MGSEPRWLIGGPNPSEERIPTQQAAPKVTKVKTTKVKVEGTYKGKTADQWREMAKRSQGNAREYLLCAQLAEQDGIWGFPALFTLTGALVPDATYIRTKQGKWVWRIGRGEGAQWFNESHALDGSRRRKNDAAKGFYVGQVRARGYVGTTGSGYFIGRVEQSSIEIVDNGIGDMNLASQYEDR